MAMPMEAAIRRCGSLVSDWLMTQKTTSPARRNFSPWDFGMILQPGGKMLDTRTRLKLAMPASRSAISKELSFSLWRPTPLVRKSFLDTNIESEPPLSWIGGEAPRARAFIQKEDGDDNGSEPVRPMAEGPRIAA